MVWGKNCRSAIKVHHIRPFTITRYKLSRDSSKTTVSFFSRELTRLVQFQTLRWYLEFEPKIFIKFVKNLKICLCRFYVSNRILSDDAYSIQNSLFTLSCVTSDDQMTIMWHNEPAREWPAASRQRTVAVARVLKVARASCVRDAHALAPRRAAAPHPTIALATHLRTASSCRYKNP